MIIALEVADQIAGKFLKIVEFLIGENTAFHETEKGTEKGTEETTPSNRPITLYTTYLLIPSK